MQEEIIRVVSNGDNGEERVTEFLVERGKSKKVCRTLYRTSYFIGREESKNLNSIATELKATVENLPDISKRDLTEHARELMLETGEAIIEADDDIVLPRADYDDALIGRERGTWLK